MILSKDAYLAQSRIDTEFEQIVKRCQRPLVAIAYRMLGNLEDARDAVQEAFLRMWRAGGWPTGEAAVFARLARILVNLCIDRLRRRRRLTLFHHDQGSQQPNQDATGDPGLQVENGELWDLLEAAAARLKPKQKAVFILRDVEGYSVRETAEILGCTQNNVLVNLHHARSNLRRWLGPYLKG